MYDDKRNKYFLAIPVETILTLIEPDGTFLDPERLSPEKRKVYDDLGKKEQEEYRQLVGHLKCETEGTKLGKVLRKSTERMAKTLEGLGGI